MKAMFPLLALLAALVIAAPLVAQPAGEKKDPRLAVTLKYQNGKTVRGSLAVKTLTVKTTTETKQIDLLTVSAITFGKDRDILTTTGGAVQGVIQAKEFDVHTDLGLLTVKRDQLFSMTFEESFTAASPAKIIKLGCAIRHMVLAPDGKSLYFLNSSDSKVQRLDVEKQSLDTAAGDVPGAGGLCLAPDGKALYAFGQEKGPNLNRTTIYHLDPTTLKVLSSFGVAASPFSAFADNEGHVYLAGGRLLAVDVARKAVLDTWAEGPQCAGNCWLRRSGDGKQLYLGFLGGFPGATKIHRLSWPARFPAADAARELPVRVLVHGAEQAFEGWLPDPRITITTKDGPRTVDLSKVGTNIISLSKTADGLILQAHQTNPAQAFMGKIEAKELKVRLEEGMLTLPFEKVYNVQRREVTFAGLGVGDAMFELTPDERHLICLSGAVVSAGGEPKQVAKVPAHHASAVDPSTGALFLAVPGKKLDVYSFPECKRKTQVLLPKQAYRVALDPKSRSLFCAVAEDVPMGRLTTGVGDIHVFDIKTILAAEPK